MAAALGFCLGIMGLLYTIVLMGIFVIVYMLVQSKGVIRSFMYSMIPMGPFIVGATLIVMNI